MPQSTTNNNQPPPPSLDVVEGLRRNVKLPFPRGFAPLRPQSSRRHNDKKEFCRSSAATQSTSPHLKYLEIVEKLKEEKLQLELICLTNTDLIFVSRPHIFIIHYLLRY